MARTSSHPTAPVSTSSRILAWADSPAHRRPLPVRLIHALVRLLLITWREFGKNDLPLRSAALTYTILLSLVPILAMSTAVIKGLGGSDQLRNLAYSYIASLEQSPTDIFFDNNPADLVQNSPADLMGDNPVALMEDDPTPPEESDPRDPLADSLTSHLHDAIDMLFDYVDKTNFATLGSFGVAGIFVSIILVFGNIELALNAIWHVEKSRSIARKVSDYITLIVLMPISINVALAASAFLTSPTLSAHAQLFIPFPWMQTLVLKLVPVVAITVTFYIIYVFFPNIMVKTLPALSGAIFAAILWFMVQNVYIRLQIGVSNYNAIYGSFATLPLFLVWIYLGWLFVLVGAQVAYACQHLDNYRLQPAPPEPALRLSAAFDIMAMAQKSFDHNHSLVQADLEVLERNYPKALLDEVEETLIQARLLHVSTTTGRLFPAGPALATDHRQIAEAILGSGLPDTQGGDTTREVMDTLLYRSEDLQTNGGRGTDSGNSQQEQSST
ncbi:MAG: YihY/virulence factor BrkB family protein [Desulfopila sp.]